LISYTPPFSRKADWSGFEAFVFWVVMALSPDLHLAYFVGDKKSLHGLNFRSFWEEKEGSLIFIS
jgi:hypothetical protein